MSDAAQIKTPSVGVLLVTHGKLGRFFLETLTDMMGDLRLASDVLEVRRIQDPEALLRQGDRAIERLDSGLGVLVITDAFGSTPSNIANQLGHNDKTRVLAGLNLPMLVRIFNYPQLGLQELADSAIEGGQRGITLCGEAK